MTCVHVHTKKRNIEPSRKKHDSWYTLLIACENTKEKELFSLYDKEKAVDYYKRVAFA